MLKGAAVGLPEARGRVAAVGGWPAPTPGIRPSDRSRVPFIVNHKERNETMSTHQLSLLAAQLFALANEISRYADEHTEWLNFGEYADLCEYETKLLAFGNLYESSNPHSYLQGELEAASEHFNTVKERINAKRGQVQ
jgi:hypothetical protein